MLLECMLSFWLCRFNMPVTLLDSLLYLESVLLLSGHVLGNQETQEYLHSCMCVCVDIDKNHMDYWQHVSQIIQQAVDDLISSQ